MCRDENGRKRSENSLNHFRNHIFLGNEIGNGKVGNENDIGNIGKPETEQYGRKHVGIDRKPVTNMEILNYKNIYLTYISMLYIYINSSLYYINYKLTSF